MRKVIAIIDEPSGCDKCYFHGCRWSLPLSDGTMGVYCQIDKDKKVYELRAGETGYKLDCCPLISVT